MLYTNYYNSSYPGIRSYLLSPKVKVRNKYAGKIFKLDCRHYRLSVKLWFYAQVCEMVKNLKSCLSEMLKIFHRIVSGYQFLVVKIGLLVEIILKYMKTQKFKPSYANFFIFSKDETHECKWYVIQLRISIKISSFQSPYKFPISQ